MSDKFTVQGSYSVGPQTGGGSGFPSSAVPILESVSLDKSSFQTYILDADSVQVVSLGGLDQAEVLSIKTVGGRARVRITTLQGSTQSIPVDSFLMLLSESDPITAIDLLREVGLEVEVRVFLGQKA